jgi:hypothetical protein
VEPRIQCCRTRTSVEALAIMAVDGPSAAISRELAATGLHEASPPHFDGEASLSVTSVECCRPERLAGYMHAGYRRDIGLHYSLACPATPASGPARGLRNCRSSFGVSTTSLLLARTGDPGFWC